MQSLTRRFGALAAVDHVTLSIPAGSLFFLLGPSGCGKTTLLRMVAGFVQPSEGAILFDTQDMTAVPPHKRGTGMVFQSYALWPHMTVAENVAFGLDVRQVPEPERKTRVTEALALVQMESLAERKPAQLSGGQQQRVALARALAIRPRCLLLDEPLSNLDAKLRLEMRSEIRRIVKSSGITALYVTHDQKEALSMADAIALLKGGKLEQVGTPEELYRRPVSRFVADFIGESNFLPATITSVDAGNAVLDCAVGKLVAKLDGSANSHTWRAGQKVLAAFRPEAARVGPAGGSGENMLRGMRVSRVYLGEMAEHTVELANGTRVKAFELNPLATGAVGEACVVTVGAGDVMVVAA